MTGTTDTDAIARRLTRETEGPGWEYSEEEEADLLELATREYEAARWLFELELRRRDIMQARGRILLTLAIAIMGALLLRVDVFASVSRAAAECWVVWPLVIVSAGAVLGSAGASVMTLMSLWYGLSPCAEFDAINIEARGLDLRYRQRVWLESMTTELLSSEMTTSNCNRDAARTLRTAGGVLVAGLVGLVLTAVLLAVIDPASLLPS